MKQMQAVATRVFIAGSILFGITGIVMVLSIPRNASAPEWLAKTLFTLGFIVLSSFGVSVGTKYLSGK